MHILQKRRRVRREMGGEKREGRRQRGEERGASRGRTSSVVRTWRSLDPAHHWWDSNVERQLWKTV